MVGLRNLHCVNMPTYCALSSTSGVRTRLEGVCLMPCSLAKLLKKTPISWKMNHPVPQASSLGFLLMARMNERSLVVALCLCPVATLSLVWERGRPSKNRSPFFRHINHIATERSIGSAVHPDTCKSPLWAWNKIFAE